MLIWQCADIITLKIAILNVISLGYPFELLYMCIYKIISPDDEDRKVLGQGTIFLMITVSFLNFFFIYSLSSRCSLCTVLLFDSTFH